MVKEGFDTIRRRTLAHFSHDSGPLAGTTGLRTQPGQWSVGEQVDHLVLAERVLRRDMAILIERAKAGQTPYLYRSFAEFNARPACSRSARLPWLEGPSMSSIRLYQLSVREYVVRYVPFPAEAPDVMQPRRGKRRLNSAKNWTQCCTKRRLCLRPTRLSTMTICGTNTRCLAPKRCPNSCAHCGYMNRRTRIKSPRCPGQPAVSPSSMSSLGRLGPPDM